jgi:pilus assembly protein CpaF
MLVQLSLLHKDPIMPGFLHDLSMELPVALPVSDSKFLDVMRDRLGAKLRNQLDADQLGRLPEPSRRDALRAAVLRLMDDETVILDASERETLVADLLDDVLGLGPLERLLRDPTISEILVNGPNEAFIERDGQLVEERLAFRDADHLLQVIDRIVARVGRRIDETSPMVDARLADGSRVNAVIPPLALKGPTLSIRRFGTRPLTLDDLLHFRALTPEMASLMEAAIKSRLNVIVSGGTGSGKTTLLNTLSRFIADRDRIITIEDAAELRLQQRHVVPLETRPANIDGKLGVSMRDLLRNALRMRPDRIIIGECRGPEALDMLQAMNSGHEGSLTTLHANSTRDALSRLETLIMMGGYDLPLRAMRRQIASAVQLIIQADRLTGGARKVTAMTEVVGMEGDILVTQDIYAYHPQGVDTEGRTYGQFQATGIRPAFTPRLKAAGFDLHPSLFQQRVLMRA